MGVAESWGVIFFFDVKQFNCIFGLAGSGGCGSKGVMVVVAGQARFSVSGRDPDNGRASRMSGSGGARSLTQVMTVMMRLMTVEGERRRSRCDFGLTASRDVKLGKHS